MRRRHPRRDSSRDGRGAGPATKIVVADPDAGAFLFGLCRQVTLRDLTVDYDPLPFCQGTIRAMTVRENAWAIELPAKFSPHACSLKVAIET